MKKIFKSLLLLMAMTVVAGSMTSCSDDDESTQSRLFRPVINEDNIVTGLDENTVPYLSFKWDNYTEANQYVINVVSEDGTESYTQTVETNSVTFNNLDYDKNYNVSIHSANTNNGLESKDYTFVITTADYPTDLKTPLATDIIDTQARISWNTNDGATFYDKLVIYDPAEEAVVGEYVPTAADLAAGNMIVRGLKPQTSYQVKAYVGEAYKGKKSFKTVAEEHYDGYVCDVRGLSPEDSYKWFTTSDAYANAIDSLVQLHPDEDITIVLQGGVNYRMQTVALPATAGTIKIVTGLTLSGNAVFNVMGNFSVNAGKNVGGLKLDKLTFTDEASKPKDSSNFGGTYLFNLSGGAGVTIGSIDITNCSIKYKRGICRLQGGVTVNKFNIDNCVADSIGGYGIANTDNATSCFKEIYVSNSTFSNCEKTLVNTKGIASNKILVENSTFVYCIADNKPFFDFKGMNIPEFDVKNCLFGAAGPHNLGAITLGINGYSGTMKPNCADCYFASDLLFFVNADTGATSPLDGTFLKGSTTDLFKDPMHSDFTIISSEVKGIGDGRWY